METDAAHVAPPDISPNKPARRGHRWYQFSLRSLLTMVTLICLALGLVVVPAEKQRAAIRAVEKSGGVVVYNDARPGQWWFVATLRKYLARDYFDNVKLVSLNVYQLEDADLSDLRAFARLQELSLRYTDVTDAGLRQLQWQPQLKSLGLSGTKVSNAGLAHVKQLAQLEGLHLDDTQISDAGLVHLLGLTQLRTLDLRYTKVTPAGVALLQAKLPNCAVLFGDNRATASKVAK